MSRSIDFFSCSIYYQYDTFTVEDRKLVDAFSAGRESEGKKSSQAKENPQLPQCFLNIQFISHFVSLTFFSHTFALCDNYVRRFKGKPSFNEERKPNYFLEHFAPQEVHFSLCYSDTPSFKQFSEAFITVDKHPSCKFY